MELIALEKHNPEWEKLFLNEKLLLENTLGNTILKVHHVGSTAVADLLAKPVVDIALEANVCPPTRQIIEILTSIGYEFRGESGVSGRYWFIKGQPRLINLHYCALGSEVVKKQLEFCDRLRNSVELRREYESLKLINSKGRSIDDTDYANSKTDLILKAISE